MVRPCIDPLYRSVIIFFISLGAIQLLVGPASDSLTEQINVLSSTRATSFGLDAHQKELGFFLSRTNVPAFTNSPVIRVHSSSEPSQI
ncbi:unannotated protein [freshwater metagenome]|uniref:Unannotated protein n=1 Tax=freshwater metagenome TaxID=449393 RepID=A0A6J7TQ58_9ZZZZ